MKLTRLIVTVVQIQNLKSILIPAIYRRVAGIILSKIDSVTNRFVSYFAFFSSDSKAEPSSSPSLFAPLFIRKSLVPHFNL